MGNLSRDYCAMEHGIIAFTEDEMNVDTYRIYHELFALVHEPKCNPGMQLLRWKKLGPKLLKFIEGQDKINKAFEKIYDDQNARMKENHNKRWREDEEEVLIQLAANGTMTMTELALALGRTPAAISTKLSALVGIGRISQEIAGRFTGVMNGKEVSGNISGTLIRR